MIRYSERARRAYARLYSPYNDIDVYVEDRTYIGLYETIINRLLNGKGRVTRVTALGPSNVVETAAKADVEEGGRPRLYIVDGDLDLIAFARRPLVKRLYRLGVYSVENLLAEPAAMEKYCGFASPALANGVCSAAVDTVGLFNELDNVLLRYFVALAVARRLRLHGATFALNPPSVARVIAGKQLGPCPEKVAARVRSIVKECIAAKGSIQYRVAKSAVVANIRRRHVSALHVVPGKAFTLKYLNDRVGAAGGIPANQQLICSYLSEHSSLKADRKLAAVLRATIRTAP